MTSKRSKRDTDYYEQLSAPARLIKIRMDELKMNQKELAENSGLSEKRISRIMRNSKETGNSFRWTERDINLISIALRWGTFGRDKLRYAVWPEFQCIDEALANHEGLVRLNCRLESNYLPLIGYKT